MPLALHVMEFEDTTTLFVALEKECFLFMMLKLLGCKSSNDGAEVYSARVLRSHLTSASIATTTTSTNSLATKFPCRINVTRVEWTLLGKLGASWVVSWGRCTPCSTRTRRIRNDVIQKLSHVNERHDAILLL
jgi:hypothetical protein